MNKDDKSFIFLILSLLAGMTVVAVMIVWATMGCGPNG